MPCLTFRMWFVGLALSFILSSANMFFYLRNPAPYWSGPVGAVLAWFGGKFLEKVLPIRTWTIFGYEFSLNPGPFNIKEHTLMYMLGGLVLEANMAPYAMGATVVWEKRYHQKLSQGYITGFGLVGLTHRLLVWPASAIWPTNLSTCATLNALHAGDDAYSRHSGPRQVTIFATVGIVASVWAFFPGTVDALSYFSFICWFAPNNIIVNQLFGTVSGLGMSLVTFDWTQINLAPAPMITPFWAQVHAFGTFVIIYWIVGPILYYNNVWKSAHLPIFGGMAYDRFAKPYNLTRVLDLETLSFNATEFENYSDVYLPMSFAMTYMLAFAIPPAILVHTILVYWPRIRRVIRREPAREEPEDVHAKLMRRYPQVPWWWYGIVFVACLALAVVQLVGIVTSTLVQVLVKSSIFAGVQDICQPNQPAKLSCSHSQVFYSASVIWGLIGPKRQFGKGGVYYGEIYALVAGALIPLLVWLWCRRRPASPLRKFNLPVALSGCSYTPPATGINYTSSFCVGFFSQYYLRKRKPLWWARYNYIVSSALDSGTAIGIVVCFLILQLPKGGNIALSWWGNNVWQNTLDAKSVAFLPTDPNVGF
ncbi:hypothetical protein FRB90_002728 [Tulasnella sp. 427]|nr:hypothetical protein FRB90_002728 [Tulasnella sp. 427]